MGKNLEIDSEYDLSEDRIWTYRENGYIKLRNVFSRDTLAGFREEVSSRVRELNTQNLPMEQRSLYDRAFLQVMNLWTKSEIIQRFVLGKRIGRIASRLMGCSGVRLYHDQALYKEPGGGYTPWHADQQYWPLASDRTITAWIPLQDTPLEMGPLAFAPGSFRIKSGRDLEISEESESRIRQTLSDFPVDEGPFELGDVSFHSGWTFHRAGSNQTRRVREVMTIIMMDHEMRLAEPRNANQSRDRDWWCPGVEAGQIVASPLNPVIYRDS